MPKRYDLLGSCSSVEITVDASDDLGDGTQYRIQMGWPGDLNCAFTVTGRWELRELASALTQVANAEDAGEQPNASDWQWAAPRAVCETLDAPPLEAPLFFAREPSE